VKLVTLFVICAVDTPPKTVKDKIGELVGLTIEDPQVVQDRKNLEKILFWKDIEFSTDYDPTPLINELASEFPQFIVFDITRKAPTFREKNSWWLGLIAASVISIISILWGFSQT